MSLDIKDMEDSINALLKWVKKIEKFSLARLKTDPVFNSENSAINILASEIHLLRVNSKKKGEKLMFLAEFFENFNTIKSPDDIISDIFNQLNRHLDNSDACLFMKKNKEEAYLPIEESFTDFLNISITEEMLSTIFSEGEKEISIFNGISNESPIYDFYHSDDSLFLDGSHFMYVSLRGFDYIMCFLRIGSEKFCDFDIEFVQGIADKIHTLINNLGQIQREIRMAEELKTAAAVQQACVSMVFEKLL